MTIDRDLLRRAWPEGYLAMRGVSTVGGWTCVAAPGDVNGRKQYAFWLADDLVSLYGVSPGPDADPPVAYGAAFPLNVTPVTKAIEAGKLLPNVDPTDTATWACLLKDLADLVGWGDVKGLYFTHFEDLDDDDRCLGEQWFFSNANRYSCKAFRLPTKDKAEALVRALIQLREKGA